MKITVEFEFPKELNDHISNEFLFGDTLKSIPFKDVTYKVINRVKSNMITYDLIEKSVCDFIGCEPEKLQKKSREREILEGRQLCHYLSKKNKLGSLSQIGFRFGKKDHATVLHSARLVDNLLKVDAEFKSKYEVFIESFGYSESIETLKS